MKLEHTCSITRRHTAQLAASIIFAAHRQVLFIGWHLLNVDFECITQIDAVEEE